MTDLNTERLVLTIPEAAKLLGISKGLMYQLTRREVFPIFPVGARKLIPKRAFYQWVEKQGGVAD